MDKGFEKEGFEGLKVKASVARRFRRFCKSLSKSQSMGLLAMLEYFEANGVSPEERMDETIAGMKLLMKRRFNALIAIIRDIEKSQTKPTAAMLQSLFEQADGHGMENGANELIEIKTLEVDPVGAVDDGTTIPRVRYEHLENRMASLRADFSFVLEQVKPVKSSLGSDHLRLNLTKEEIDKYRRNIQNP